jgi:mercuric ion binding protein
MKQVSSLVIAVALLASSPAQARERTVRLFVANMSCPSCPYIVRKTLARVPGVSAVDVSFEDKTATVTFDDNKASVASLTEATANAGYPSILQE